MSCTANEVEINGVKFVRATPNGNRAVVVVDRGWIFAGDVTERDGRIRLDRAVHVLRWESIGFDGMLANPKAPQVKLRALSTPVDLPTDAEVFRCPVGPEWGL